MIVRMFKKNKLKKKNPFIEPDEIFLDSENLENFNRQQFEGRMEKPISKQTIAYLGFFFILLTFIYSGRLWYLEVTRGEAYYDRSQNNTLAKQIIFADRGIIYDRNKVELAWDQKSTETLRKYKSPGFAHLLGYVSYPQKDRQGNYWQTDFLGRDGLEKEYNDYLKGLNGSKIVETDAKGKVHSENIINAPKRGKDLQIAVDSRLQGELYLELKNHATSRGFTGGAGVLMDVASGEILALTSYPEYDSEILSLGRDVQTIKKYNADRRKVFLDRSISGLYA